MANELTDIIRKINESIRDNKKLRTAITTVLAVQKPRIFEKGLDINNSKIGKYSTNPTSISKKNQARQTGKTYFPGGYSEYKRLVGRNPGFVILRNTDQMYQDYGLVGNGLGFQNPFNYDKSIWLQDKYDTQIFDHSERELNIIADVLAAQVFR